MPAGLLVLATVVGTVAATIVAVVGPIIAAISATVTAVIGPILSIVGGVVNTVAGIAAGIAGVIGTIGKGIVGPIVQTVADVAGTIANTVTALSKGLTTAIESITLPVMKTVTKWKRILTDPVKEVFEVVDEAATAIITPIKETLQAVKGVVDTIRAPVDAILEPVKAIRETIESVSSLKIIGDVLDGTRDLSELIGPIAKGKSAATAQAIVELYKSIVVTTISTMDKIDSEFVLLGATIDSFDERIKTSIQEKMALAKAEVLSVVTPQMTTLGRNQGLVIRGIARISRHVEDEAWFVAMLLRALR